MSATTRTPNSEQQKAIYHTGGKLLSAGAGSGKTFVLVEHLVYLLEQFRMKYSENEWTNQIRFYLRSIVLMTFTKKAAGEMSVRLLKKIEDILAQDSQDSSSYVFWSLVKKEIGSLNILTIHGFCHRLLRRGYWTNLPVEINLVDELEHREKISALFDKWFKNSSISADPLFVVNSKELLNSLCEIFSSPELRIMWKKVLFKNTPEDIIQDYFEQVMPVSEYRYLFQRDILLSLDEEYKEKKWYKTLFDIGTFINQRGPLSSINYQRYLQFLDKEVKLPNKSKDMPIEIKGLIDQMRSLREELKDIAEDFEALKLNFSEFKKWHNVIYESFLFIEDHYFEVDGFSFADLEYFVLLGLEDRPVADKIGSDFSYLIIDEFQDTSSVQFNIIRKIIADDWKKVFAVGDRKQAIYGFRGGEVKVFEQCSSLLGDTNNLFLKNNYRSEPSIINYNNDLFDCVFPLGLGFQGKDAFAISMQPQEAPTPEKDKGEVVALVCNINEVSEDTDLDQAEAEVLCNHLEQLIAKESVSSICILYRKLAPSRYLLELLFQKNWAYIAQVKIDYQSDPIIKLFYLSICYILSSKDAKKRNSISLLLSALMTSLEITSSIEGPLNQFEKDSPLFGLNQAFYKLCLKLGISNAHYRLNLQFIDSLCKIAKNETLSLYHLLSDESDENYSFEMMGGELESSQKKRIIIMTAHASKGLEFDAVCLAGIHTNGRYMGMREVIGKLPDSFKWKCHPSQKKFFKTPHYFLEEKIMAQKDFSESKRLLYVACTRAVKHLAYVDLSGIKKGEVESLYFSENSWIQAMRCYPAPSAPHWLAERHTFKTEIPLLLRDSMGVVVHPGQVRIALISELSVTRMASIAQCPFKFYLQNICRIEPQRSSRFFADHEDEVEEDSHSSMKRGTKIHQALSDYLVLGQTQQKLSSIEEDLIKWALKEVHQLGNEYSIISEKMIKFSFFGHMISGTPDVVFLNKDSSNLIVWDFKTGKRDQLQESAYWFQLYVYSYAYALIEGYGPDKQIEISLLYLDEQNKISKKLCVEEITQQLFWYWSKIESLDQVNHEHCPHCEFAQVCKRRAI